MENFIQALAIMGKGMAGIFIVTIVIILCMILLCRLTSPRDERGDQGTEDR